MKLEGESSPDRAEATPDISLETAASPLEPRSWSVPSPYGAPAAVDSLSTIAAPLLGGFSITLVGVVVQASEKFRFSSIALLLLTVAAVLLLLCVQCGFWARHYYTRPDEATAWWPDYEGSAERQQMLFIEQRRSYLLFKRWSARARRAYSSGIVALFLGIMVTLVPDGVGWQSRVRWAAVVVMGLAAVGELLWLASMSRRMRNWLPRRVVDWFVPRAN
jgi:hypothetical protein